MHRNNKIIILLLNNNKQINLLFLDNVKSEKTRELHKQPIHTFTLKKWLKMMIQIIVI